MRIGANSGASRTLTFDRVKTLAMVSPRGTSRTETVTGQGGQTTVGVA